MTGPRVSRCFARRWLEGGGEQVAGRQAAVGPPLLSDSENLLLAGQVIQPIYGLDGLAERQVSRQDDVLPLQRDEQGALNGPGAYPGDGGELGHELVVVQGAQHLLVQPTVRHPLG